MLHIEETPNRITLRSEVDELGRREAWYDGFFWGASTVWVVAFVALAVIAFKYWH